MFAGGARVSWHFAAVGPVVTVEVEELHPIPNAIATTDSSTNECRATLLAIIATRREGSVESIRSPGPELYVARLVHTGASGSDVLGRHGTSATRRTELCASSTT